MGLLFYNRKINIVSQAIKYCLFSEYTSTFITEVTWLFYLYMLTN